MPEEIRLVENDSKPDIDWILRDRETNAVIDVTNATVKLYFRAIGSTTLKATKTLTKPNGGGDGRVRCTWSAGDLNTPGEYEGDIEITFLGGTIQTVFEKQFFRVRSEVGP